MSMEDATEAVEAQWAELSRQSGCDEKLVYAIGKEVADKSHWKPGSDNHSRLWLAAQAGARAAFTRTNSQDALIAELAKVVSGIKWKSADRDNMEFEARITYVQMDQLRATLAKVHPHVG
jgi:hypothetical protein